MLPLPQALFIKKILRFTMFISNLRGDLKSCLSKSAYKFLLSFFLDTKSRDHRTNVILVALIGIN
jgi:hypothetical protein